jgi:AraC-like DNA-binding protein
MIKVSNEDLLFAIDEKPETMYVWHSRFEDRFQDHTHLKGQLTYVEGGIIFLYTKEKSYFLPARHYVWIPAGVEHHLQHRYHAAIVRNIYFDTTTDDENPFYKQIGIYPVNNLLLEMFLFSERWNGNIVPQTKEYDFLNTLKNILPVVSEHPLPIALPTTENQRLRPVLRHIVDGLADDGMSLESVGKAMGFSERTLSRLFQSALDTSFFQYLKLARMIKAMEKLLESDATISEIAYQVGYNSISSFSNTFYKMVGKRPSDFKELKQSTLTKINLV